MGPPRAGTSHNDGVPPINTRLALHFVGRDLTELLLVVRNCGGELLVTSSALLQRRATHVFEFAAYKR